MEKAKLTDENIRSLINSNHLVITEQGNQLQKHERKIERIWKQIDNIEQRKTSDMKDQWEIISELIAKVKELETKI